MKTGVIIQSPIHAVSWDEALDNIAHWASHRESKYVCICNVHSVITATPIAWVLRRLGFKTQQRVNGPDLMLKYMARAEQSGESVFFYGNTEPTLQTLIAKLLEKFPKLKVAGRYSPPFRALTTAEDHAIVQHINDSGAGTVWVSLGCPKQEKWMEEHRGRISAVMIGVGAAFDYHAGTIKRAPAWMQNAGLEWAHRLASEPKRLWKRYLSTNSVFLYKVAIGICTRKIQNNKRHQTPSIPSTK